jgi:nitric-oxide synthase
VFVVLTIACAYVEQNAPLQKEKGSTQMTYQQIRTVMTTRPAPLQQQSSQYQRRRWEEARTFCSLFSQEQDQPQRLAPRLKQVQAEIAATGTYWQTEEELAYGARVAWRNSSRCIGRLYWRSLQVRDQRHLSTAEEIFEALVEHLIQATNGGKIRPMISIFAPRTARRQQIRIWNPQLIRYAGYEQPDGSVIGDPSQRELTEIVRALGWQRGTGGPFDVLPLIIQVPPQPPRLFALPPESVLEVPLSHPDYAWFETLGLKWHALPVISNMRLEIGGISYSAAPFNGWYMGTEIGARNLGDVERYNLLPRIAQQMGLDTRKSRALWQDRAIVELNVAVLHSFAQAGVSMVDHHTASRQFQVHQKQERQAGRALPADWGWIVPPISASTTEVFHTPYEDFLLKPNFFAQSQPSLQDLCPSS